MITIPNIQDLIDDLIAALEAEFDATINPEGKAFLRAQAVSDGGILKSFYLAIGLLQKNVAPDSCDEETLLRFGLIKLGRVPFSAVAGRYDVTVTGTTGGVIPAGTIFKSDDDALNPGILYQLDSAYTMPGTTGTINLRCLTLGLDGKLDIGDTLTSTAPIPLVDSSATVTSETVQPLAAESIEAYRTAVINSYRLEAQGGAASDYRIWAADAQGVAKVYPYARSGYTAETNLYVEATVADSTDGKGTPSQQILDDVEDVVNFNPDTTLALNERGRRPLQVIVNYLPIEPLDVNITIASSSFTSTEQTNITNAIKAAINEIRPFVAGADIYADKNDILDTNKIVGVIITTRPGAVFGNVTINVDGVDVSTYTFTGGYIPYPDTVTFL